MTILPYYHLYNGVKTLVFKEKPSGHPHILGFRKNKDDAKDLVPMGDENGNLIEPTLPIVGKLCVPQLGDKWLDAQEETLVDGKPAITVQCTVACKYGGVISFIDDGQEV